MERSTPWLVAAVCALVGGGLWVYRTRQVTAAPPAPAIEAPEIVRNAWLQGRSVSLDGRQIIRMAVGPENREVEVKAHVLTSDAGYMRIEYQTEPLQGVTVWENAERTYRYNPKYKRLTVAARQKSATEEARQELELLERNYQARKAGTETVAGRPAVVLELHPRKGGDRWKRLSIDSDRWVILKSEDRSGPEKVLRVTRYTDIQYLPKGQEPAATQFRPSEELIRKYAVGSRDQATSSFKPEQLSQVVGFTVRLPRQLPQGYVLQGAYPTPCLCRRHHQAVRLEYTDGLNTLTLFEAGYPDCPAPKTGVPGKAVLAREFKHDGLFYLAIGEVDPQALEQMVRSAAPAPKQ